MIYPFGYIVNSFLFFCITFCLHCYEKMLYSYQEVTTMGIGSKLSKLIEANNANPNELARKVGVSPQTIYSIIKR